MIEGLTFKVLHDASPEATPAEGHCNMNACQLGDPVGKKPHSAKADRFSLGNSARLVSKDRIDFGSRGRPTPVPTYDVLPIRRRACCRSSDEGSTVIRFGRRCDAGTHGV
jgi:hypothetical protein